MNISLVGPTCAGKTTCATRLCAQFQLRHLSTGQVLRENWGQQTVLGLLTRRYVERGELVPDEIITAMIEEAIRKLGPDQGVLLDGFPSTLYQALFLEEKFREMGRSLDAVVLMHAPDSVVFVRASKRVPARPDDRPGILRRRLQVFRRTTGPVLEFYRRGQQLVFLDARGSVESVQAALAGLISRFRGGGAIPAMNDQQSRTVDEILTEPAWERGTIHQPSLDFVILGAPGSGKGTHATFLARYLGIPHLPTGNLFREHLKGNTILGRIARSHIEQGELVPDDVTEAMVRERLNHPNLDGGFILDGFPRTVAQAQALEEILEDMCRNLAGAIYLSVPDEEIIARLSGRWFCPTCQTTYHEVHNKPRIEGVCDQDATALQQRDDDTPETVRARLKVFHGQTIPVTDYYRQGGFLMEVPAVGEVAEVDQALAAVLQPFKRQG